MLIRIQATAAGPRQAQHDVGALLLSCHERIRRFTSLALHLAAPGGAPPGEVAEAAAAVHRYFHLALPLHAADEDESLRPRLLAAGVPAEVAEALLAIAAEHVAIEAVLAEARPLWLAVAAGRTQDPACRAALGSCGAQLEALFLPHLALEERLIFPAVRHFLDPQALEAVSREMRQRRAEVPAAL